MNAWGKTLDADGKSGVRLSPWISAYCANQFQQIRFIADPSVTFTKALDLNFDGSAVFGGHRSKRYALVTENGKVTHAYVEPDNTGLSVSAAEKVLG